jgi:hypothetical protein
MEIGAGPLKWERGWLRAATVIGWGIDVRAVALASGAAIVLL